MKISKPWWASICVAVYYLLVALYVGLGTPDWAKNLAPALGLFSVPALLSFYIWVPVLKPIGLTNGEWVSAPKGEVMVLLILFYCAAAYFLVALFVKRSNRKSESPLKSDEG